MGSAPHVSLAVVGMACRYPGAANLTEFWNNVLGRRVQFRDMPACRLSAEYFDSDPSAPDKTYGKRAAVLDGFRFDPIARRVPKRTAEGTDMVHWLSLEIALAAVEDAKLRLEDDDARKQIGVVLGNTLTGEETRANTLRTRWPFVRQALYAAAAEEGLDAAMVAALERRMEGVYKSAFPPVTEDTLAGGLSNTIAGRICNYLDLGGGAFTIDGACSSSLLAVTVAGDMLRNGRADVMLVGGVDVSLDPFELVGFAKATALSKDEMRVYDQRGAGFIPGEGCGFVVLKRLADAERDGDRIYGTVEGWGISTDGKGALTAPTISGQALSLRRAYEMAGYAPASVAFVEGHGTGTRVGDRIELCAVSEAVQHFTEHVAPASIGMTSLKSIVGHAKAAAGIGGFIKAMMATSRRIAPPMAGCEKPHEVFSKEAAALYPLRFGRTFDVDAEMRSGVSAMGFGGINCHVTIQAAAATSVSAADRARDERELASWQSCEVFPFAADTVEMQKAQIDELRALAKGISVAELSDLSVEWASRIAARPSATKRAALVATNPDDLLSKLDQLKSADWRTISTNPVRTAFVFSGQGSQRAELGLDMFLRFPWARALFELADRIVAELAPDLTRPLSKILLQGGTRDLDRTEIAQPAICLVSMLWTRLLERLGMAPTAVAGHSLGELTALWAAGAFSDAALLRLAAWRGRAMAADPSEPAGMLALFCTAADADAFAERAAGYAVTANYNGPQQQVVAGTKAALAEITEAAKAKGIRVVDLPVSNAFHSKLVSGASQILAKLDFLPERADLSIPFHSGCVPGAVHRDLRVREYLADQVVQPVHFEPTIRGLAQAADWILEVGPGQILTGLSSQSQVACMPVAADGSRASLMNVIAEAWSRGTEIAWSEIYATRASRTFVPAADRLFYQNPCERLSGRAPTASPSSTPRETTTRDELPAVPLATGEDAILARLLTIISDQTGFPPESLTPDLRLLDNLNLDSIKSMALLDEVGRTFGIRGKLAPSQLAQASIGDLVAAVTTALATPTTAANQTTKKADATVASFHLSFEPATRPAKVERAASEHAAIFAAADGHDELREALSFLTAKTEIVAATTQIVIVPRGSDDLAASRDRMIHFFADFGAHWKHLGAAGRAACQRVVFVQRTDGELGRSGEAAAATSHSAAYASSFALDEPSKQVIVVDVPHGATAGSIATQIEGELSTAIEPGIRYVSFDAAGARREPRLHLLQRPLDPVDVRWSAEDVILVTGGGKGITAECAIAFARATGARLALVGRSAAPTSASDTSELADTLRRCEKAGVRCAYFACDVADGGALERVIADAESALGPITGVVHGAGMNKARRIEDVSYEEARAEIAPKLEGAAHLCRLLGDRPLKLFAALTSVIGVAGMVKNAWYAFANEQVDNLLRAYRKAHPQTHVVCLAYSAWDEVGMGAKMGSLSFLSNVGMSAIPVDDGVSQFLTWTTYAAPDVQVVVTGRMGNLPSWRALRPIASDTRANRFVSEIVALEPEIEIIARGTLTTETHPFLRDHDFHGSILFPTVMGMEAMAEAVRRVSGRENLLPLRISGLELERPILVGPRGTTIEIRAKRIAAEDDEEVYAVRISSEETSFEAPHFHGEFHLGPVRFEKDDVPQATELLPISPKDHLYGRLLFQGPLFQKLEGILALDERECSFATTSTPASSGPSYLLGDPYARDVLLQTLQLIVTPEEALPIRVRSWRLAQAFAGGKAKAHGVLHTREGQIRGNNVTAWGEDGAILEQLVGYEVKVLGLRGDWPTPKELAKGPAAPQPSAESSAAMPDDYSHLLGAKLAKDGPHGQLCFRLTDMVTMRHAATITRHASHSYFVDWMGRLREAPLHPIRRELGADLRSGKWGLVSNSTSLICEGPVQTGDLVEGSGWASARGGPHDSVFRIGFEWHRVSNGERVRVAHAQMDATWVAITGHGTVEPRPFPPYFERLMREMLPPIAEPLTELDLSVAGGDKPSGPLLWSAPRSSLTGPLLHEYRTQTGQTHSNLVGNVYFANYSSWQVAAIDAMLQARVPALYSTLEPRGSELRCARASIRHLREAMPFDAISVDVHLQELYADGVKLACNFWRRAPGADQEKTKLAAGEITALWSTATSSGTWQNEPMPKEIFAAFERGIG